MTPLLSFDPRTRIASRALVSVLCALCVAHGRPAQAQQPEAKAAAASPASGASAAAASAAPDKVYPPLPSLAMLPPPSATDSDDDTPPRKTSSRKKGAKEKVRNEMPTPHLVVSDATRTYLNSVEQDIEHAMPK
ncbi:exported protein of unknown function [Pararobbsia alpina]|uniref:hypothetical protein n=1 Tax=Pararobbsia alpina TaxID=621374 RepID=UPI0039A6B8BF